MKFVVSNLHTGRTWVDDYDPEAFEAALHTDERGTGEFKRAKAKNRIELLERSTSAWMGTGGVGGWFLPPGGGLMTINHLFQQKALFHFSVQMKV